VPKENASRQTGLFCAPQLTDAEVSEVAQSGGSRGKAATSDRHVVRLAFQSASALIDYERDCRPSQLLLAQRMSLRSL
jgi:hypothetical protein